MEQIGPYKVLQKIAAGGMGTVYLAAHERHLGFRKLVAIKQLHPHLEVGEEAKRRFAVEARIGASLAHPNIVSVLDLDTEPSGGLFFVMEYVHGCSLRALVERSPGPLPPTMAAFIIHELARALDAAHTFLDTDGQPWPVIHRDVNPKNVLLSDSGEVKLTDFGIAKIMDQHLTTVSGLRGTIGYMSPEQANGQKVDARTDIYSCGVILHELLLGGRAITGGGQLERLAQAQKGIQLDREALAMAGTPAPLTDLLRHALARDPADRLPTAAALQQRLEDYLRQAGQPAPREVAALVAPHVRPLEAFDEQTGRVTVTAPTPVTPDSGEQTAGTRRRGPLLGIVVAAAAIAGVIVLAWPRRVKHPTGAPRPDAAIDTRVTADSRPSSHARGGDARTLPDGRASRAAPDHRPAPRPRRHPARAKGRLMFNTEPRWSVVWIDGRRRGNTPLYVKLPAGRHRIVARPLGTGKRYTVTVRIAPGKTTRRVLTVE